MHKYLGSYYHLPQREDLSASGGYQLVGTAGLSQSSGAGSFEHARIKIPGGLTIGTEIIIKTIATGDITDFLLVDAAGRNNTYTNIGSLGGITGTRVQHHYVYVLNFDAIANNARVVSIPFGNTPTASVALTIPYLSDAWDVVWRNDVGVVDTRQLVFASVAVIRPGLLRGNEGLTRLA
jgi:hypothetical protein